MEQDLQIRKITVWENYELVEANKGRLVLKTKVTENSLNPYQSAHGGYLYTLCDSTAGRVTALSGSLCVTLQASVNYLKEARENDVLTICGTLVHDGRSTKVVDVEITNEKEQKICKASFTMYVVRDLNADKEAV